MEKEHLNVEFRYYDKPHGTFGRQWRSKTISVGIFDTLEEAITEGNKTLDVLRQSFKFAKNDVFSKKDRLICNHRTKNIDIFARIEKLKFEDLHATISELFKAYDRAQVPDPEDVF